MKTPIQLAENELFEKWKKEYNIKSSEFADDGVVCPEDWINVKKKTIFLLKETNGCEDLRSHLHWGGSTRTWANIARWQYGIQNSEATVDWDDVKDFGTNQAKRKKQLHQICAINLKKQPGGSTTNSKELKKSFIETNLKYFAEQISLYQDVKYIICCSKDIKGILFQPEVFKECFGYDYKAGQGQKYNDVWTYKLEGQNTHIISFRHPCIYGSSEPAYQKLVRAIQELEANNK